MNIPEGFTEMKGQIKGVTVIADKMGNEYMEVRNKNDEFCFWISNYEISENTARDSWIHPGCSMKNKKPWQFIDLLYARIIAKKAGGRLPTDEEYDTYYAWCKQKHIPMTEIYVWVDTPVDENHYITRKRNNKKYMYNTRKTNGVSFRIVLNI